MIVFKTPGQIDLNTTLSFGVSAKESDHPIGIFGTGLKYAIAGILRLGGRVQICTKGKSYIFTAKKETFRGKEFSFIYMNDDKLHFTTHLGAHWEPWQYYRELYSNTVDEGGEVFSIEKYSLLPLEENFSYIIITLPKFEEIYNHPEAFILPKVLTPIYENRSLQIFPSIAGHTGIIYYQGIRIATTPYKSNYNYNIKEKINLTEDRTLRNIYDFTRRLCDAIVTCENSFLITTFVTQPRNHFESQIDLEVWSSQEPSSAFLESLRILGPGRVGNPTAFNLFRKFVPAIEHYTPVKLSEIEEKQLERSKAFLERQGFNISQPIVVTDLLTSGALGAAAEGVIFLSRDAFRMGTKEVASTILEEHLHITTGYADCTRSLQSHLFSLLITALEHLDGEPL